MKQLILYSTLGCHLCDQAEALILSSPESSALALQVEDISESDDLMGRYGIRIPVVADPESEAELGWPFDQADFSEYFSSLK